MEESKDSKKGLVCPFCGAPYKDMVPSDAAQLKCEYCGGIFPVLPYLKDVAKRCPNHPEVFATGLCNDCGKHFCTRCLYIFDVAQDTANQARLYLCPECFKRRQIEKADYAILAGVATIFFGFIALMLIPVAGVLFILLFSVPMIVYGLYRKYKLPEAPSVYEVSSVSALTQDVDIDALYAKMLGKYAARWGVANAKELLDNEIYAYVRSGLDYEEAVRRVARAKGIMTAESEAEAKAETEEEAKPKETRKSKMIR